MFKTLIVRKIHKRRNDIKLLSIVLLIINQINPTTLRSLIMNFYVFHGDNIFFDMKGPKASPIGACSEMYTLKQHKEISK